MIRRSIRAAIVPAVLLTAGACFATRNDVRTLQGDIAVLRAENARSDSVHRAQFQSAAIQAGALADSLRSLNAFLARFASDVSRFNGDLSINMHTLGQQLLTLQELAGQNQKRLQDVRAEIERQQSELATAAQPSTVPGAPAAPSGSVPTGPAQLYSMGKSMLDRSSYPAARAAFGDPARAVSGGRSCGRCAVRHRAQPGSRRPGRGRRLGICACRREVSEVRACAERAVQAGDGGETGQSGGERKGTVPADPGQLSALARGRHRPRPSQEAVT